MVTIAEATTLDSVSQISGSWEEIFRIFSEWNIIGIPEGEKPLYEWGWFIIVYVT